jgi:hypothetical protein
MIVITDLSVILFEIDVLGVSVREGESYAPRTVDMDGVPRGLEPHQPTKVEAWKVHVLRYGRDMQSVEPPTDSGEDPAVDFRRSAGSPEVQKGLVFERGDHRDAP